MSSFRALTCPFAPFLLPVRASAAFKGVVALAIVNKTYNYHASEQKLLVKKEGPKRGGPPRKRAHKHRQLSQNEQFELSKTLGRAKEVILKLFRYLPDLYTYMCQTLLRFRDLLRNEDIVRVIELYPNVVGNQFWTRSDTLKVFQLLHEAYRQKSKHDTLAELLKGFENSITEDYLKGSLPGNPAASVHLLSLLRESKQYDRASEVWSWLAGKDQEFVSPRVYGVAIEIQTQQGVPLERLEETYKEALKRFPGQFLEYHFSPTAIVPDRSQLPTVKGASTNLLQGIFTARILNGDWHNGYLAFDTALRLFPTQVPPRFFDVLIHERPTAEAYHAFIIACRAGIAIPPRAVMQLLGKLQEGGLSPSHSVLSILDAMIADAGTRKDAKPSYHYVGSLVKAMTWLVTQIQDGSASFAKDTGLKIVQCARKIVLSLVQAGVEPDVSIFNALATMSLEAGCPKIHMEILRDMGNLATAPNMVTFRALLKGTLLTANDLGEVSSTWNRFVKAAEEAGEQLQMKDWLSLVGSTAEKFPKAGREFVGSQLGQLKHTLTPFKEKLIRERLQKRGTKGDFEPSHKDARPSQDLVIIDQMLELIQEKATQLIKTISSPEAEDLFNKPVPLNPLPQRPAEKLAHTERHVMVLSAEYEKHLRILYEELTVDPYQAASTSEESKPAARSRTNYPLDELRFQNWKSVISLMMQAEQFEGIKAQSIEDTIAQVRSSGAKPATTSVGGVTQDAQPVSWSQLRQHILELRGHSSAVT